MNRPATGPVSWKPGSWELPLLILALAVRVAWAMAGDTALWFDHIFNDATAWNLAQGNGFSASAEAPFVPAIFRTPGYPCFLSWVYSMAGHSVRAAFVANALLDTATCWLVWHMAAQDLGWIPARWVLLFAATYPFTVHSVATLSPESLMVLVAVLLVKGMRSLPRDGGTRSAAFLGTAFGLACWIKPVFLPFPAFLLLAERVRGRTWAVAWRHSIICGLMGALLFAPWVARNHKEFGRPVLAGELGIVVWHGTRDFAPSRDKEIASNFDRSSKDPTVRYESNRRGLADSPAVLARDREYLEAGLRVIRARPLKAFLLDPVRRVPRLWISMKHVQLPDWVGWVAMLASLCYLTLGFAGLWTLRRRLRDLAPWLVLPVMLTLAYAALHVEARYTLPARPSLLLFAGVASAGLIDRLRRGRSQSVEPVDPPIPA